MIKLTAKFLFLVAMLCSLIAFGCGGSNTAVDNKVPNNTAKNDAPKNDAPKNDAPKSDAPKESANTGVPECDEYIEKYEACLTSIADKYPQAHPGLKSTFESQRKAYKDAASTPQGKSTLPGICKQALETTKQATSAYACKW